MDDQEPWRIPISDGRSCAGGQMLLLVPYCDSKSPEEKGQCDEVAATSRRPLSASRTRLNLVHRRKPTTLVGLDSNQ